MNQFTYSISKKMYDSLLNGRKDPDTQMSYRGLGTRQKVIEYVNKTFGLLGEVVELTVE